MTGKPKESSQSFVTVIVPMYNAVSEVRGLVRALGAQTFPTENYEVLLVDNGSKDGTRERARAEIAHLGGSFRLLLEAETRGSYAARNLGLAHARGQLIAFTDVDCRPVEGWLEAGVRCLEGEADLAGGPVEFRHAGPRENAAEWLDARTNMQIELGIERRGVAKTANLFVRSTAFASVGKFPQGMLSGGDVAWTRAATSAGLKLVFAPEAKVRHPSRSWVELFQKQFRVGLGHSAIRHWEKGMVSGVPRDHPRERFKALLQEARLKGSFFAFSFILAATLVFSADKLGRCYGELFRSR
jgi:glycosyltransferase involved in cell wall biosynthesis